MTPAGTAQLRAMTVSDLTDVIALEHELFPDDPWSPEMFASELAQPDGDRMYLVASLAPPPSDRSDRTVSPETPPLAGPVVAGYGGMLFVPGGTQAEVMTIAVRQDCWGHGIGSLLLGAMLDKARDRGSREVFLEVRADNDRAHDLYLRRGFAEIGVRKGYYQPSGTDAIVMRKEVA